MIGIKFLLDHGHFIQAPIPNDQIGRYVEMWRKAWLDNKHVFLTGASDLDNGEIMDWTIFTARIIGVHTFNWDLFIQAVNQQGMEQGTIPMMIPGSGLVPQFGRVG